MSDTAGPILLPHFVLFADILGFAALIDKHGESLQSMHSRRHFQAGRASICA
jgi:hypothetical protein